MTMVMASCQSRWSISVNTGEKTFMVDRKMLDEYQVIKHDSNPCEGIPLEIVFYQNGIQVIESISIIEESTDTVIEWSDIAESSCLEKDGKVNLAEQLLSPSEIKVALHPENNIDKSLTDIFPTVLQSLGIESPQQGISRHSIFQYDADHVVLIFLDGLGGMKYDEARKNGYLSALDNPDYFTKALTVFPPRTTTASSAINTGKFPGETGVYKSGIRKTDQLKICDVVTGEGLSAKVVEGESMAFDLGNCEFILSGDKDGNGGTDDNVFIHTMEMIDEGLPIYSYIHFHGIDDMGHSFGPDSEEVDAKIIEVNAYLQEIFQNLPEDTLVITFSDHGMHTIENSEDKGNHGNLIAEDMVVFIHIKIIN